MNTMRWGTIAQCSDAKRPALRFAPVASTWVCHSLALAHVPRLFAP
jgi:hypothetical protein